MSGWAGHSRCRVTDTLTSRNCSCVPLIVGAVMRAYAHCRCSRLPNLSNVRSGSGYPLRIAEDENRAALDGLMKKLRLSLWDSPVRWAAYVGLADSSPHEALHRVVMPDRPAMSLGAWKTAKAAILAATLAAGPSESMAVVSPREPPVTIREERPHPLVTIRLENQSPEPRRAEDDVPPGVEYNRPGADGSPQRDHPISGQDRVDLEGPR